ncbi:MAG: hypothetical protein C7B43_01515 [Sulfobacillus benefaciens]|uniref:DUF4012 domain-containing protein n=1 Tax=Sulfobacillus benefaciens TaxID=453960 RepID=A0A2T2XBU7_9FIRM|nr:MAG: hypothetical protein C7B43_01515 [Sulfobacillus benefaciens]
MLGIIGVPFLTLAGTTATAGAAALYAAVGVQTRQTQTIDTGITYLNDTAQWYRSMVWTFWPLRILDPHNAFLDTLKQSGRNLTALTRTTRRAEPDINHILGAIGFQTPTHADPSLSHAQLAAALFQQLPNIDQLVNTFYPTVSQWNQWIAHANLPSLLVTPSQWHQFQNESQLLTQDMQDLRTALPMVTKMIPAKGTRRYFLVYENSGELRSTGGFMTAYSYVTFKNGHLQPLHSHNIYDLQPHVRYRPPAPLAIHTWLYSPIWHLRDSNWSPNVPTAVQQMYKFYNSMPNAPRLNGVIFVNTWVADTLLKDIGGITMPTAYHNLHVTSSNANYEMEYIAERSHLPAGVKKKFIGTMLHLVVHKLAHSSVPVLLQTVHSGFQALNQKDVLFYFNNPQLENMAKAQNWAGTVDRHTNGDYLEVVDDNLGGHKDNFYMHYHVTSRIQKIGSRYRQTTTVTWTNTGIFDNWLVVPYTSWVRFYVPYGSRLISLTGGNAITQDYTNAQLHKTVFGNHLTMPDRLNKHYPPTTRSMTATYWLPKGINMSRYVIQKQPGIRDDHETIIVNGHRLRPFRLYTDTTVSLSPSHK